MKFKQLPSILCLALSSTVSYAGSDVDTLGVSATDCLAYWQLRSLGLAEDYSVDSAVLAGDYNQKYQKTLDALKTQQEMPDIVRGVFGSMRIMLSKIDDDYARANELVNDYEQPCELLKQCINITTLLLLKHKHKKTRQCRVFY